MKLLRAALCLLALCLATRTASAAAWTVGTHRASGSYSCRLGPFSSVTFTVDTYLYLAQTSVPHQWGLYLSGDFTGSGVGVTLDVRDSSLIEADDNGAVVYSVPQETVYVHRLIPLGAIDYTHDESAPPYSIQVTPVSTAHPYGQLVVALYPQGYSDPTKGECAEPVAITMEISP